MNDIVRRINIMKEYTFSKEDTLSVKAIAVMLMLMHHLFAFPDKLANGAAYTSMFSVNGEAVEMLLGNFGKLCVALFMLLSGIGMYKNYMMREQVSNADMSAMIIKRAKNAYIKYWQILIIFAPIGLIIGAENMTSACAPVDWVKNFLAIDTTFNNEAWFLTLYLLIICCFPLIIRWFGRKHSNPWSDIVWLLLFNTVSVTVIPSFVGTVQYMQLFNGTFYFQKLQVVLSMIPMFMAGCFLAKYEVIEKIRACFDYGYVRKIIGIIMIIATFLLRQRWAMRTNWGWDRLDFIYAASVCIAIALIIDGLTYVKKGLSFVGKYATGIWLIHSFFCYYYFQQLIYAPKNSILIFILLLGISLFMAWGLDYLYGMIWKFIKPLFVKEEE